MSTVNNTNTKVDATVRVFDQFYAFEASVPAVEYDIVNSFFESVFKTKQAARNFTSSLFRVAQLSGTPVLTLLEQINDNDQLSVSASLAYFLNATRSPTTLLGVNQVLTPNVNAARNVLP